jgi:hypothetical protein
MFVVSTAKESAPSESAFIESRAMVSVASVRKLSRMLSMVVLSAMLSMV